MFTGTSLFSKITLLELGFSINNGGLELQDTFFKKEFLGKPKDSRGGKKNQENYQRIKYLSPLPTLQQTLKTAWLFFT